MKQVTMTFKKSTKGTHVYEDSTIGTAITTLYIKRDALPASPPLTIEVSVTFDEN